MKKQLYRIGLAAALVLATVAAKAEEAGGEAELTISDAKHRFVLKARQSDWSGSSWSRSTSISLVPIADTTRKQYGSFHLGFAIRGNAAHNPEARFTRRGSFRPEMLFAKNKPKGGGLTVKIENLAVEGTFLKVSGRFTSKMGPSKNFGRDIDLGAAIPVTGTFSVTLARLKR